MAVLETPSSNTDDIFVRIERTKKAPGEKKINRKGFNSQSGMMAMTDKALGEIEQPTVDRSQAMIKHLRFIGKVQRGKAPEDVLTAHGAALYEFLMASARIQGLEQLGEFRVSYEDAKKYLEIEHNRRLEALATQLKETQVEYDFKIEGWGNRWGRMPLLLTDFAIDQDRKKYIMFSIHPAVREVIRSRETYTRLEINAFAQFKCKYTARIYPRLAMIAGFHAAYRKPWKITPQELAKLIDFKFTGEFHWGNFEKGCLKKVMEDIRQHVTRFEAKLIVHQRSSRGSPVDYLEFTTSTDTKHLREHNKVPMTAEQYKALNTELKGDETQFFAEMPSAELLRIGGTKTGYEPTELLRKWKLAITQMHKYPQATLPDAGLLTGEKVLEHFFSWGVGAAFELWLYHLDRKVQKYIPVRSAEHTVDMILRVILMDPEIALDYCNADHPEWQRMSIGWNDTDRAHFKSALSVFGRDEVPHDDRLAYFTKIAQVIKEAGPEDVGMMVGKISDFRSRKYRLATSA
ncbi:RepB family plasmid replication initiator protein [Rhizobium leguminosarum]|uniref:RepB family plasmid replication initiator protein n=1 Tax=Rhizobium leguminosarum TaxID=384 RepID=A0A7K3VTJ0_RHILE|nr:RepB family plasmid replication initiator protein [Rhizobium leguminosarum]NEK19937.1 RepB family plasmid replication initiator protein [Rhizobium leguminosarum]